MTFCLLLGMIGSEMVIRFSGYSSHYIYDPIYRQFGESDEIPYVHQPNLSNVLARGGAKIHTDELGLRSVEPGKPVPKKSPDEYRIAVLGDSVTFGEGVENTEDTFCVRLEEALDREREAGDVSVLNFGVSAYSVKEMAATLEHRTTSVEPDLFLLALIPSDFDLERTGSVDRWGFTASRAPTSGMIDADSVLKKWMRRSHLIYFVRDVLARATKKRARGFWSDRSVLPSSYAYVQRMNEVANKRGLKLGVVLLGTFMDSDFGVIRSKLVEDGILFLDLSRLPDQFSPEEFNASKFDGHPSALVHEKIAGHLSGWIKTLFQDPSSFSGS